MTHKKSIDTMTPNPINYYLIGNCPEHSEFLLPSYRNPLPNANWRRNIVPTEVINDAPNLSSSMPYFKKHSDNRHLQNLLN